MARVFVTLPDGALNIIKDLKGTMGDTDSEVVRNLVISYLVEKGYLLRTKVPANATSITKSLETLDIMVSAIVTVMNNVMTPKDSFYNAYNEEMGKLIENQS